MKILKQSTAAVISFGPHLDKSDGNTLETGLVSALDHVSTGIKLSKNGGALTIRHATVTASTYDSYGNYLVTLDTTDTDTVGRLRIQYADNNTTALPVWDEYFVLPANVYDSLVGSDLLQIDVTQLLGTAWLAPGTAGTPDVNAKLVGGSAVASGAIPNVAAGAAGGLALHFAGKISGSVNDAAATTTSFIGDSGLSATDDIYNGCWLVPTSGTLAGIPRRISDYVGATKTFTFNTAFPSALANGVTFFILGRAE